MLVKTINDPYDLQRELAAVNRDYYSFQALEAILEFFNEDSQNVEFDAIAIACDFNEEDPEYIFDEYSHCLLDHNEKILNEDGTINYEELLDTLNYFTYAVMLQNGNILYIAF